MLASYRGLMTNLHNKFSNKIKTYAFCKRTLSVWISVMIFHCLYHNSKNFVVMSRFKHLFFFFSFRGPGVDSNLLWRGLSFFLSYFLFFKKELLDFKFQRNNLQCKQNRRLFIYTYILNICFICIHIYIYIYQSGKKKKIVSKRRGKISI